MGQARVPESPSRRVRKAALALQVRPAAEVEEIGKERFDEWVKQCVVRDEKAARRYTRDKFFSAKEAPSSTFGEAIEEMFGKVKEEKEVQQKWYGKYYLVSLDPAWPPPHPPSRELGRGRRVQSCRQD